MKLSKRDKKLVTAERLKATGRMASEIAHELNTPIGGILMYSHLLLEDFPKDDPRLENMIKINKLAHRCKIIIQGLLDFGHQERPQLAKLNINPILKDVMSFLEDHILLDNISIQMNLAPDLPKVAGEENKLEQAFINLIVNAAQAMSSNGNGTLDVTTEYIAESNQIRIGFADTGCGIDEENMGTIFEPFFTTKEKSKGTGLGLSICHGIVERHRGTMTVESTEGQGSLFTIFLPVAD